MKHMYKLALCTLALVGLLATAAVAQNNPSYESGIASYHISNYFHAKRVLKDKYPDFFVQFSNLETAIASTQDTDKQAQFKALMDFFPAIEKVTEITPNIKTDVVVSFFVIPMETANETLTSVDSLLFDAFKAELPGGDASRILSEKELMDKHHISLEEAQHIRNIVHQLYPSSTLNW